MKDFRQTFDGNSPQRVRCEPNERKCPKNICGFVRHFCSNIFNSIRFDFRVEECRKRQRNRQKPSKSLQRQFPMELNFYLADLPGNILGTKLQTMPEKNIPALSS